MLFRLFLIMCIVTDVWMLLYRVIDEMIDHISGCVHYRGFQQETPLHDACSSGYVKVARRLLEMGADVGAM